jgi:hypothetical protein
MRTVSILLALAVVPSFVREAEAIIEVSVHDDYTIWLGTKQVGFHDGVLIDNSGIGRRWSFLRLGPLGSYSVPFTATQGLIGFIVILAMLIILPAVLTVRWIKKRAAA